VSAAPLPDGLTVVVKQRIRQLARIVYPDNELMATALDGAIRGLCALAWAQGARDAVDHIVSPDVPPTHEVEALASETIRRAQQ
jgi:hypothetical protein